MLAASHAATGQSVVFQAANFPPCFQGPWKAAAKENSGGSITGRLVGFKGCADPFGFQGNGTPNDPYRLALDGKSESVEIEGLEATTRADYTVQVWFRLRSDEKHLTMLVDSRADRFYVPLRMRISEGKLQCSIEMPFPDRIYVALSSHPIALSNWYHGACRFRAQSRELSVFLNGSIQGSTRIPPGSMRSNRIRIGGDPTVDGENFPGDIAEVVFSETSDDEKVIQARCKDESHRFAGAECGPHH
jgi:Concanavalin A-like lectin/glucanases superfamily